MFDLVSPHNEKDFNLFREDFELIVAEQYDNHLFGDEDKESLWERFKDEVLSSYIKKNIKNDFMKIKNAFMKIFSIENVYDEKDDEKDDEKEDEEDEE